MKHPIRTSTIRLSVLGLLALVTACGNRDDSTAPTGNGTIVLTLTVPSGAPSVTVTGPDGFSRTVSATTTLQHLVAGSYTITADSLVIDNAIVGYDVDTAAITGNPIIVTAAGSSAATVTYALARQHGALWVAGDDNSFLSGFARSQLTGVGDKAPADTIGGLDEPGGVAFNSNGDMWVSTYASDSLKMFTVAQRNVSGSITAAARTIQSASLSYPFAMSFDSHGNLWVADYYAGLLEFSAAQVAAGGSGIVPNVTLEDTVFKSPRPYAVAFDAAGNAWVGEDGTSHVIEYTVAQLATSGMPVPHVRIGFVDAVPRIVKGGHVSAAIAFGNIVQPLDEPDALAFDAAGNLWVGNYQLENVVAYSPAQQASSGNPTPAITISIPGTDPYGITFDKSGGLWVSDDSDYSVFGFSASQIATSGTPTPQVVMTNGLPNSLVDAEQLAFDEWVVPALDAVSASRAPYRASVVHNASHRKRRPGAAK